MRKSTGFLSIVLMSVPFLARSSDTNDIMLLHMKDQSVKKFMLVTKPEVTFGNNEVIIWSAQSDTRISVEIGDVASFEFVDSSAVGTFAEESVNVSFDNDRLSVTGLQAGSRLSLYDASGLERGQAIADASGVAVIKIVELPGGVYIVSGNGINLKVYRR